MAEKREPSVTAPRATLGPTVPILRVADLAASVRYYVERLGFHVEWEAAPVASVGRDGASLMLSEGDQGLPGTWVWISTKDVDALYAEFAARGAELRHPPTNYPWGSRECQITDPDGHVLRFGAEAQPDGPLGEWLDGAGRRWRPEPDGAWRAVE